MIKEITDNKNRNFERHGVYTPAMQYNGDSNKFRFKNSLIITPNYEIEFHAMGGIKYIKNHDDRVFFTNDGIFALTNNIKKIPVLLKRGINKQSVQKKLIIEEKYNYEEKYEIYKNIVLYYEINRIDYQILFNRLNINSAEPNDSNNSSEFKYTNIKDITAEFYLNLPISRISDRVQYKKYESKEEYNSALSEFNGGSGFEYLMLNCEKECNSCMTLYPGKKLLTKYDSENKSLSFTTPTNPDVQKNYINVKIYLEKYKIT